MATHIAFHSHDKTVPMDHEKDFIPPVVGDYVDVSILDKESKALFIEGTVARRAHRFRTGENGDYQVIDIYLK